MRWAPASINSFLANRPCPLRLETLAQSSWNIAQASQAVLLQMEKIADGKPDGLSIFRIPLQAWCAQDGCMLMLLTWRLVLPPEEPERSSMHLLECLMENEGFKDQAWCRKKYTRALVQRLPFHRSLPIVLWLLLARLLRWKPPVPQIRDRVIR